MKASFAWLVSGTLALALGCGSNGGTTGAGGTVGSGGASGHGAGGTTGAGGVTGGASGRGGASGTGGASGQACGRNVCGPGETCCNASCGLCVPAGAGACIAIVCTDGGIIGDASACVEVPTQNSQCTTSAAPNFYRCILTTLPPPCIVGSIGDVTNTYCCP